MRYFYKDANGQVYEYESHADREQFGPTELVPMTEEEVAAHLAPVPPTEAEIIWAASALVQGQLDEVARSMGYDDIKTAVTYADEPAVPKFQNDGIALRRWRSLVWAKAYSVLDEVKSGERAQPSGEELLSELPEFEPAV